MRRYFYCLIRCVNFEINFIMSHKLILKYPDNLACGKGGEGRGETSVNSFRATFAIVLQALLDLRHGECSWGPASEAIITSNGP